MKIQILRLLPLWVVTLVITGTSHGQVTLPGDTTKIPEAVIESWQPLPDFQPMSPISGTFIMEGKKSEVISLTEKDAAITEKYARQVFAKVPGLFVYDMDGTGNQLNIATRGLDPHRSWEFNFRKDGVITNTDMYGYPASHYNMPMEAIERIELVRGTGSLQYGAQFGGMLNFVSKAPDSTKALAFETFNTIGSFGLVSNFNRLSGTKGKFSYSGWINRKKMDGYRDNSASLNESEAVTLFFRPTDKWEISAEYTRSNYVVQLPGQLTDSMFNSNPRMATRSRNFYQPNIKIASVRAKGQISDKWKTELVLSRLWGERNSVLFDRPANVPDTINSATRQYAGRQVDIDLYDSRNAEWRVMGEFGFLGQKSHVTAGVQYMDNEIHRRQQGKGTTGTDYDLSVVVPEFGRNIFLRTSNIALFVETRLALTEKWVVTGGARIESGESAMTGNTSYYPEESFPASVPHRFPLFGAGTSYYLTEKISAYAGWSQAYRPVLFKDLVPASLLEKVDPDFSDADGYNAEVGVRGQWLFFKWDVTAFRLVYNNRPGTRAEVDSLGQLTAIWRTNIGNSVTDGIELFVQADIPLGKKTGISVFNSTSFMDARYVEGAWRVGDENIDISGNKVESAPDLISRTGLTFRHGKWSATGLFSYVSETYADALNTEEPSASGAVGLVPAYGLLDFNFGYRHNEHVRILFNVNNATDLQYFTKRPQFYPGPGIWPSDGRSFSLSLVVNI